MIRVFMSTVLNRFSKFFFKILKMLAKSINYCYKYYVIICNITGDNKDKKACKFDCNGIFSH